MIILLPCLKLTVPFPPQPAHLVGAVPDLHLLPEQALQTPLFSKTTSFLIPLTDSMNDISTFIIISAPLTFLDLYCPSILKNCAKSSNISSSNPLLPD